MEEMEIKYSNQLNVVMANKIIRAEQDELSLMENKLIKLVIAQIAMQDTELYTYSCKVTNLAKFLGISRQSMFEEIDKLTADIMHKVITIRSTDEKGKEEFERLHWVEYCKYTKGVLTIRISYELKPYLLALHELFTSYQYSAIVALPTVNSLKLFELLASFVRYGIRRIPQEKYYDVDIEKDEMIFSIEYLRKYFNCEDKYLKSNGDFINFIIKPSVKFINKKALFPCTYRTIRKGRALGYVAFNHGSWGGINQQTPQKNET